MAVCRGANAINETNRRKALAPCASRPMLLESWTQGGMGHWQGEQPTGLGYAPVGQHMQKLPSPQGEFWGVCVAATVIEHGQDGGSAGSTLIGLVKRSGQSPKRAGVAQPYHGWDS